MSTLDRLPALPLIVNDPYFSIWMPADTLTGANTTHWTGAPKPLIGQLVVDGKTYTYLGSNKYPAMETTALRVTPTHTVSTLTAGGVELTVAFWAPALPTDPDALSTPITYVDFTLRSIDKKAHNATLTLLASCALCYDGTTQPAMYSDHFDREELHIAYTGQRQQRVLGHSGDHVTIDWGYLYMAAPALASAQDDGSGLRFRQDFLLDAREKKTYLMLGYDDIASVNYFGAMCRAWYRSYWPSMPDALCNFARMHQHLHALCCKLDDTVQADAMRIGGEDYRLIVSAAWRHTLGAHKLIATPDEEMALLSKENDSNGCIGTVDVSYPSTPLFLKYAPELVNALCRPVLEFADMPVWDQNFAPHDVGRYPYATGQVYGAPRMPGGMTPPPYYQYPAGSGIYDPRMQMPVEECGNMLIMLEAALAYGASPKLLYQYSSTLEKWVRYLDQYGEDPGDQLCTDDFAGHLAHNVNLSAKAIVGIACYARLKRRLGRRKEAAQWEARAHEMADSWLRRAKAGDHTALTFDGAGWSMKYNLAWDLALELNLLPREFYAQETRSYLAHMGEYGLPLDSRADYTKSDWILWTAAMAQDEETFKALIAPVARYLRETTSRVPFSDWYDTRTGRFVEFIARSVQGGVFMPLLMHRDAAAQENIEEKEE